MGFELASGRFSQFLELAKQQLIECVSSSTSVLIRVCGRQEAIVELTV